jgi:hypothetical protein
VNSLRPLQIAPEVTVSLGTQSGDIACETFGLVILVADDLGAMRYVAPLGRTPVATTLPFDPWWNDKVLYSQGQAAFRAGTLSTRWHTATAGHT